LRRHGEAGPFEQAREPFSQENVVVREHNARCCHARVFIRVEAARSQAVR
jgi:hypothetical protein